MKPRDIAADLRERLDSSLASGSDKSAPPSPPPRVPDHELLRCIGRGNYGEVWLARSVTGGLHAAKVVWRRNFSSERPYDREFQGIVRYEPISRSHPAVVPVLHVGRDEAAGFFYYVMELADDAASKDPPDFSSYTPRTLRSDLKRAGRLPLTEALQLGVQLADALGHLHRNGLVHRDVKPSNVIYIGGHPRLADIGLVASIDEARSFVGTEGFIPPEGPGTPQADLFALGKLLYEAATGGDRCDFPSLPEDLNQWPEHNAVLELNEVLARACSPSSKLRHANAAELAGDLNLLLAGRSIRRAYSVERRLRRFYHAALAASAVALVAVGALWFQRARRAEAEQRAVRELALRQRAQQAENEKSVALRQALLEEARARVGGLEPQRRSQALRALTQAAAIRRDTDLRTVAATALATPEIREVRTWERNRTDPYSAAFDPTCEQRVTADASGTIILRRVTDDTPLVTLPGPGIRVDAVTFSPDSRWLVAKHRNGEWRLWNLPARTNRIVIPTNVSACVAFSADSRWLAAWLGRGVVAVEDLDGDTRRLFNNDVHRINQIAVHPTLPLLAIAQWNTNGVIVMNLTNGAIEAQYSLPRGAGAVAWHPSGTQLAVGGTDYAVRVWNWPGDDRPIHLLRTHKGEVVMVHYHPAGRWLLCSSWDGQSSLWHLEDAHLSMVLPGEALAFSTDGRRVGFNRLGESILADFDEAFQPRTIPAHMQGKSPGYLSFTPDGRWLVTGGDDGARLWDAQTWREAAVVWTGAARGVGFSEHPARVYVAGRDKWRAWELPTQLTAGRALPRTDIAWSQPAGDIRKGMVEPRSGRWFALERDRLPNRTVLRIGSVNGNVIRELHIDSAAAANIAVSPDGRWAACGTWKGSDIWVADLTADTRARRLLHPGDTNVEFSPDSHYLVISGVSNFRFLETGTWREAKVIPRDRSDPSAGEIAFAHRADLAALIVSRSRIRLVDWESGREFATLSTAEERHVSTIAFAPDDRHLVAASTDHHLLVWDLVMLRAQLTELDLIDGNEATIVPAAIAKRP